MGQIDNAVQSFYDAYRDWSTTTGMRLTDAQQYWLFRKKLDLYQRVGFFCFHQYELKESDTTPGLMICTRCHAATGWKCDQSPDHIHHCYRKGDTVRLLNGEFVVPDFKQIVGHCVFCGETRKRLNC